MSGVSGTATRTVALWVPDWPVTAAVMEGAAPAHLPVAVHDGRGVTAVSALARREGVRRGTRRRSAQATCPELVLVAADEGRDIRTFEPLVQAVETVVAGVEVVRPGIVVMPARGPSRHAGSEDLLAELLVGRVAEETGAECQVGIADGILAAVLAAREGLIVRRGGAAEFLAPRDVRDLQHTASTREARAEVEALTGLLRRLGLRTLGAFAALPYRDVLARFGGPGSEAHRLARGQDARPPVTRRPEQDVMVRAELDPPVARTDAAAFVARGLAEQLHDRMLRRSVICARLRVEAGTENGQELVRTWRIDSGLTAAELTDRVRWQLEGWVAGRSGAAPAAPLVRLELVAEEVSPANAGQDALWGQARRGEVAAGRAALRLQGVLGPEGVLVPVLQGGRDPRDMVRLVAWGDETTPSRPTEPPWPGRIPSPLPATVPAEPVPVQVLDAEGRPLQVSERGALSAPPEQVVGVPVGWIGGDRRASGGPTGAPATTARVTTAQSAPVERWAGPWPVTERWWTERPHRRSYLQLLLSNGVGLLVAAEAGAWWLEGVYD